MDKLKREYYEKKIKAHTESMKVKKSYGLITEEEFSTWKENIKRLGELYKNGQIHSSWLKFIEDDFMYKHKWSIIEMLLHEMFFPDMSFMIESTISDIYALRDNDEITLRKNSQKRRAIEQRRMRKKHKERKNEREKEW